MEIKDFIALGRGRSINDKAEFAHKGEKVKTVEGLLIYDQIILLKALIEKLCLKPNNIISF